MLGSPLTTLHHNLAVALFKTYILFHQKRMLENTILDRIFGPKKDARRRPEKIRYRRTLKSVIFT
jgi:hypothetical protein